MERFHRIIRSIELLLRIACLMDDSSTLIDRMISGLLPGFLIIGALVALVGEFHLPFWLALVLIAGTVASTIAYVLRIHGWELSFPLAHWKDLRWVVVPAVVAYTSWLDPTHVG